MPIKKENRSHYPGGSPTSKEWRAIRAEILDRAGNACEQCRVPNGAVVTRGRGVHLDTFMMFDGRVFDADTGMELGVARGSEYDGAACRIVLTIAHLDQDPTHNDPGNLRALCQRHHLAHDRPYNKAAAFATRRSRRAVADLFG